MSSCLPSTISIPTIEVNTVTLSASDWSNSSQTATALGVTTDNVVITSPAPASAHDYVEAGCLCVEQGEDTLTFTCEQTPSSDLAINVLVFN